MAYRGATLVTVKRLYASHKNNPTPKTAVDFDAPRPHLISLPRYTETLAFLVFRSSADPRKVTGARGGVKLC